MPPQTATALRFTICVRAPKIYRMLRSDAVLAFLIVLTIFAVSISIAMLRRGRLYDSLEPKRRPRRWVLFSLRFLSAVFLVWFPIWMLWPNALVSRLLMALFGVTFFVVCMTLGWFSGAVDWFVKRRGWPLR